MADKQQTPAAAPATGTDTATDSDTTAAERKKEVQAYFGATAQNYVASVRHASGWDLHRLVELCECAPDAEALDIATGGGHTALHVAPHVRSVVASDLTPDMLAAAEAHILSKGMTNVTFVVADAEALPFADASFDIVTCRIAPHHFTNVAAFCSEVARVLRPGGRFVMIDSWVAEDAELDHFINHIEWRRDTTHGRSLRLSEWSALIEGTGLAIDVIEPFERRHEFAGWTTTSRMADDARDELDAYIAAASPKVHAHFDIRLADGKTESFVDHKFLVRARKPLSK